MSTLSEDRMEVDAKALSAGMMYRSRRRRSKRRRVAEPEDEACRSPSPSSSREHETAQESGFLGEEKQQEDDNLVEYVTRELGMTEPVLLGAPQPPAMVCSSVGAVRDQHSQAGLAARRSSLQRRSSLKTNDDFREVITKLENLGDEIDDKLSHYISRAIKELSAESADDGITSRTYKRIAAKLFQEFQSSWMTIAALYRLSDELLDESEKTGTEDNKLEARLQSFNGEAILEYAGDFWKRVGGMTGILTASKDDMYGPESSV